ncbi:uncharacterized protein LOC124687099 isoform X2 [Lolium rigidum]|uniref:uncharacterized protein LOC124687099 isoform X2 n=1 Tax=Lolium rigidum TaxID=89674 RepID=UPI001F5C54A3|nr:uncharacterized protein LOC124687099 isoform X2 [Lolium rigidum]
MPPRRRSSPSFLAAVRRTERGDGAPVAWSSSSLSSRSWSSSRTSPSTSSSSRSQHVFFLISDDPDVLELTHFAIKPRTPVPRSATRSLRATLRRISLVPLPLILQQPLARLAGTFPCEYPTGGYYVEYDDEDVSGPQ